MVVELVVLWTGTDHPEEGKYENPIFPQQIYNNRNPEPLQVVEENIQSVKVCEIAQKNVVLKDLHK